VAFLATLTASFTALSYAPAEVAAAAGAAATIGEAIRAATGSTLGLFMQEVALARALFALLMSMLGLAAFAGFAGFATATFADFGVSTCFLAAYLT